MARKILLADDSVTAQNMGRKILADAGYEVITVNNGSAALKKISEQRPDLIVLDVYMPGYSGLEVCQRLKETQDTARIPILLTVGKLEPFKPEEAKRTRADGFIVKPFEASELLSALTKLEDKIVPRAESSKPGRFARTIAIVEEGRYDSRYDKTMAVEEDAGWKNRISFPTKKKKAAEEEGSEETYGTAGKDLPKDAERKTSQKREEAKAEDHRVDLAALAPDGLPKDVTPEEIAALAAAAAQMKGKAAEVRSSEPAAAESKTVESKFAEARTEAKIEEKAEAKTEAPAAVEIPREVAAPVATFAEQKPQEKTEVAGEKTTQADSVPGVSAAPQPSEVATALRALEPAKSSDAGAGNGSWAQPAHQAAHEPVTMAAAAGVGTGGASNRWTAVSAEIAPEEAAISLEHEMQKAYAAFAAAEIGHAGSVVIVPESKTASEAGASSVPEPAPTETAVSVPATPAPEAAHALSAVASVATEAVRAAVKEFEMVAASFVDQAAPTPAVSEPARSEAEKAVVESAAQTTSGSSRDLAEHAVAVPGSEGSAWQNGSHEASSPMPDAVQASSAVASGNLKESEKAGQEEKPPSQDAAAMAAAAGAEKAPENAPSESEADSGDIANIVDSVLADMRPKIVAEISRKLGKKK